MDETQNDMTEPTLDDEDVVADDAADAPVPANDAAKAAVRKANEEAKRYRLQLRELESRVKEFEDAQLSETDRAKKRASELEAELERSHTAIRDAWLAADVTSASNKLGIVDPEVARVLITPNLEFGSDGRAQNLDDALAALVEAKPYLIKASSDTPTPPRAGLKPQPPKGSEFERPKETDAQRRHRILTGGASNAFDPAEVKRLGGGVFLPFDVPEGGD